MLPLAAGIYSSGAAVNFLSRGSGYKAQVVQAAWVGHWLWGGGDYKYFLSGYVLLEYIYIN